MAQHITKAETQRIAQSIDDLMPTNWLENEVEVLVTEALNTMYDRLGQSKLAENQAAFVQAVTAAAKEWAELCYEGHESPTEMGWIGKDGRP